jgi:hypothetical protein
MRSEWPTRASEAKEMLYFISALVPFLGIAAAVIALAIALQAFLGETAVILIAVAALAAAPLATYLRFPAYLRKKAEVRPKIALDGNRLVLPTMSGQVIEMTIDAETQMEFAYYHLHGTTNTGVSRGLWLELKRDNVRALITGNGAFTPPGGIATKNAPHAPLSEKVSTFASDLILIQSELRRRLGF